MADLNQIDAFINDLSSQGAAWYSVLTNRPAIVPGVSPQIVTAQQQAGIIPAPPAPALALPSGLAGIDPVLLVLGALLLLLLLRK